MDEVRIFTTPTLEGIPMFEYKGYVSASSVRAVDIIKDIFTSFRGIFGGRSETYKSLLRNMEKEVIEEIKQEALKKGANAIIGFTIDYDSIGVQGKSLLMLSGRGTAVVIG